ncbi:hypothetical protein JCM10207_003611 [Rhodosporidiobolus poonsookiae]
MDVPVQGPTHDLTGGLQFDENLNDLPQGLAAAPSQPSSTPAPQIAQFPSVLAAPPQPHAPGGPAPGIPVNVAPQQLPPLGPALGADGNPLPPKRPRGRPRKVPGTESRGPASAAGTPGAPPRGGRPRGRPRGSRARGRGRGGRGGKRARMSSDEDEFDAGSETASEPDDEAERDEVDLNNEVDDDFGMEGRAGATTKFGRKISKPKSFVPTNRPTIHRKKRQQTLPTFDANLMCEVCRLGHSPQENRLVICDSCTRGFHQLCASPPIQPDVVDSPLPYFCKDCDAKLAALQPAEDVTSEERHWTTGVGEEKKVEVEGAEDAPGEVDPVLSGVTGAAPGEGAAGAETEKKPEEKLEKEDEYSERLKREWLEGLPLKTLVGYVLSVEKKFAPLLAPSEGATRTSLPIWPPALPQLLATASATRAREAAERDRKLELQAEALAAAQGYALGTGAETATNSEVGTPISFEGIVVADQGAPARTAASRRAEQQAAEAAQAAFAGASASPYAAQQQQPAYAQQQQQQQAYAPAQHHNPPNGLPPFMRNSFAPVSALSASAGSPSPAPGGADIPVGASSVAAQRQPSSGAYAAYGASAGVSAAPSPYATFQPSAVGGYPPTSTGGAYGAQGQFATGQHEWAGMQRGASGGGQ